MTDADLTDALADRVGTTFRAGTPVAIVGGETKSFLGRLTQAEPLAVSGHRGIVAHEPTELVFTARAGTTLDEADSALAEHGQMLAFEPPRFGDRATLGGTIAAGLSGPRRPFAGAGRDFVLGARVINGKGEVLSFGGRVMKNVAGYDVSRAMAGSMGTLAVLLDVSLKVLPLPAREITLAFETDVGDARERMVSWAGRPLPISGACHDGERLRVRLSGTESGVASAAAALGGEPDADGERFWEDLREQRLPFFSGTRPLWRVSVPPATPALDLSGDTLVDWGGALRWVRTDADPRTVRDAADAAGGHATLFRHGDRRGEVFHPLPEPLLRLHRRLKAAFDPKGILNPGRMYGGL